MGRTSTTKRRSSMRENMGDTSLLGNKSGKVKKIKIRPMPDFSKLHKKWEQKFSSSKAQAKRPLTMVQAFGLSKKGDKTAIKAKELGNRSPVVARKDKENMPVQAVGAITPRESFVNIPTKPVGTSVLRESTGNFPPRLGSANIPRESFGTLAQQQQIQGLNFEADSSALESILNETGVATGDLEPTSGPPVSRGYASSTSTHVTRGYTSSVGVEKNGARAISRGDPCGNQSAEKFASRMTESGFKIPPLPSRLGSNAVCTGRFSSLRESLYHRGCEACRSKSAVANQNKATPPKPPTKANERRNDPNTPHADRKAERVLLKSPARPHKSPGERLTMTESRATRVKVRTPLRSPAKGNMAHLDANTTGRKSKTTWRDILKPDTSGKKDKLAVQLQFASDEQSSSKAESTELQRLEERESELEADIARLEQQRAAQPAPSTAPRPVLGQLPAEEINRRSRPEFRQEKESAINAQAALPHYMSPTKSVGGKKVHFASPSGKRNQSPSGRYMVSKASPRTKQTLNSPKAPRASALKTQEGRYSPLRSKAGSTGTKYNLGNQRLEQQVCTIMTELDKENCSPRQDMIGRKGEGGAITKSEQMIGKVMTKNPVKMATVRRSTVKILKETDEEYLLLEESFDDMSIQEVNTTLNESIAAMETLNTEAESLLEQSTIGADDSVTCDLAEQLNVIQQKQEELLKMQQMLQKRLAESKAKKREKRREERRAKKQLDKEFAAAKTDQPKSVTAGGDPCGNVVDVSPIICSNNKHDARATSVVDMSPITTDPVSDQSQATALMRTPGKGASPALLYKANKRSPLFPPLESTASESVYQRNQDAHCGKDNPDATAVQGTETGAWLAAGLLQMAQELNATPHKNTHWKKQMLKEDPAQEHTVRESRDAEMTSPLFTCVGGESFTKPDMRQQVTPIGKPLMATWGSGASTTTSNRTPVMSHAPHSLMDVMQCGSPKLYGSPQRILSGSAQVIPLEGWTGPFTPNAEPILTPLSMREKAAAQKNKHTLPSPGIQDFDISIDASKSPEEFSMAFSESPDVDNKSPMANLENRFMSENDFHGPRDAFQSPKVVDGSFQSSPGSAFKSPAGRRRESYIKYGGMPFTSPVQFTLNRDTSIKMPKPRPTNVDFGRNESSNGSNALVQGSDRCNQDSVIQNGRSNMSSNEMEGSNHVITVMAPSFQNGSGRTNQESPKITPAKSRYCSTETTPSARSPRCSTQKINPKAKAFSPRVLMGKKSPGQLRRNSLGSPGRKVKMGRSPSREIGELSLLGNVKSPGKRLGGWSELHSQLALSRTHKYVCDDLLADQEVQFYTARMQELCVESERCRDPVSEVLQGGDQHHFVPIPVAESRLHTVITTTPQRRKPNSAFSQIRV